jgi:fermentation-respiration switch protein FrsA (DUF1100 family)
VIIVEAVFLIIFWAWVLAAALFLRNTMLPRMPVTVSPQKAFRLPSEQVVFRSTDGLRLEGWKIAADSTRPWIILCHGVGSNRSDLLEIAAGLHDARFNLLLFDFRAHGRSEGWSTSFGWHEQRDLEGALVYLGQQPDIPERPYGVYGISMGASVALMVAAKDERLGAVAVDSPYVTLEESIAQHAGLLYPMIPRWPFLGFVLSTYWLRFGVWPRQVSPQQSVTRLAPRPLLLIQGAQDPRMPPEGARRLYDAASHPKELWLVDGAGHLEAFATNPQDYVDRLSRFFNAALR